MGRKKANMQKKIEKIDSLFKTERLLLEQQGKIMDRTSQYCLIIIVACQGDIKDREDDKDV